MRVLFINTTGGTASHGRIAFELAREYESAGHECKIAYGRTPSSDPDFLRMGVRIGTDSDIIISGLETRLFDSHGFGNRRATKVFLKWAEEYNPDILWLHNLHGYYINVELLFAWIKSRPEMEVKWTLHDCWAFTGHCACFSEIGCEKWKDTCFKCPQKHVYPAGYLLDRSTENQKRKARIFSDVKKMQIITPSQWLADLVGESILKEYPVQVIHNTIDTKVFKPTDSDFRMRYGLTDKYVVLAVANVWQSSKGMDDLLKLSRMLDDRYAIVIVGVTEKQKESLEKRITSRKSSHDISIPERKHKYHEICRKKGGLVIEDSVHDLFTAITGEVYREKPKLSADTVFVCKTQNAMELAGIYTMADVFVNPTREDNFPTVNLEAQACGTWVITYDTGGAAETISE